MSDSKNSGSAPLTSRRSVLGLSAAAAAALTLGEKTWATVDGSPGRGPQSLGYVVVPGQDLDVWSLWAPKVLGLQLSDRSATTRVFRMDDYEHRFAIDQSAQMPTYGWEVADGRAMDATAAGLEAGGVKVTRGSRALAAQRGVSDLLTLSDPAGNSLEIFHGPARASAPFQPARMMRGFRTGALGMGHTGITIPSALFENTSKFYRELLGFRVSDFMTVEGKHMIEFLHINPREHSLVIGAGSTDKPQLGHIMMEMQFMDDVGQSYDIVTKDYYNSIAATIGRHNNDLMTSFYVRTPSEFQIECGWGGLSIDPQRWQAGEWPPTGSIWGHHLMQDGKPVKFPFPLTERPLATPLQVYGENFETHHRPTTLREVLKTEPVR
jgi:2,3-dihydroxybiphenyl 1,2-dioxygenase